jgi:hypothetical protein
VTGLHRGGVGTRDWLVRRIRVWFNNNGDHVRHSRGDLVESCLTIMMNNLDVTPDFMNNLSQMEQEVLEVPPRH